MEAPGSPYASSPESAPKRAPRSPPPQQPSEEGDDKEKPTHLRFLVSNTAAGCIIGKGGSTINEFQSQSGARIQLSRSHEFFPGTNDRIIMVSGLFDEVLKAMELILDKLFAEGEEFNEAEARPKVRLVVPNSSCGGIIGKGGATIKSFIEQSHAGIKISPQDNNYVGLHDRLVTVTGTFESQMQAIDLILNKLSEDVHYPPNLSSPFPYAGLTFPSYPGVPVGYMIPQVPYNNAVNYAPNGYGGRYQNTQTLENRRRLSTRIEMRPRGRGDDAEDDDDDDEYEDTTPLRSTPEPEADPSPAPAPAPPQPARAPLSSLVVRPPLSQENGRSSPPSAARAARSSSPAGGNLRRGSPPPRRRRDFSPPAPSPRGWERRRPGSPPPQRRRFSPPRFQPPRHPRFHDEPQGYGMNSGPSPARPRRQEASSFDDGPRYTRGYQGGGRRGARVREGSPPYGRGARSYGRGFSAPGKDFINIDGEYVHRNDPNLSPREGDWICQNPNCGNLNFARRTHCNNCNKHRYAPEVNDPSRSPRRGYFSPPQGPPRIAGPPGDRAPPRDMARYRSPPHGWAVGDHRGYAARSPPDRAGRFAEPSLKERMGFRGERDARDRVKFNWPAADDYRQRERQHDGLYLDRSRRRSGSPRGNWGNDPRDRSRSPPRNRPMKSSFTGRGQPDDCDDPYVSRGRPNNLDAGRGGFGRGGYRPGGGPYPGEGRGDRRAAAPPRGRNEDGY